MRGDTENVLKLIAQWYSFGIINSVEGMRIHPNQQGIYPERKPERLIWKTTLRDTPMSNEILAVVLENVDSLGFLAGLLLISRLKLRLEYSKREGLKIALSLN